MPSNIELALITKVIDTSNYHALDKASINDDYFSTPEGNEAFRYLSQVYRHPATAGQVPSRQMLAYHFPTFPFFESSDTIEILVQQLREEKVRMEIEGLIGELQAKNGRNPLEALAALRTESTKISALAETSQDYSLSTSVSMMKQRYETVAACNGIIGIPFPWQVLNEETRGMQNGQYFIIYGRPKSMKTFVALKIGVHAYLNARRRVLVYSREMPPEQLLDRLGAVLAKVDYKAYTHGRLQPSEAQRMWTILEELRDDELSMGAFGSNAPYILIVSDRGMSDGGGIGWLQGKIREYKPDLVIVDGMYLMKDDRTKSRAIDWKNITHISQDVKLTCNSFHIPIIGVTQANRGAESKNGEDLTELAFADAIGMDADLVLRIKKQVKWNDQAKRHENELWVTAPGFREGTFEGMVIHGKPGYNFDYIKTIQPAVEEGQPNGDPTQRQDYGEGRGTPRLRQPSPFTSNGRFKDPKVPSFR